MEPLVEFARALIRQPSITGEEGTIVQLILAEMRRLGFDQAWVDPNGSAIGILEGGLPGPRLLLDAHCDTVGIAPGSVWTHDPFGAQVEDGFIYGRGAADMKGALAAMIHGAAAVERSRIAGRIVVSATVMEEVMEGVSLKTVMEAIRPDFVIIGEATALNLNRGGRGRAEILLETIGKPAHSSSPHLGVNAVHAMLAVVAAVERLQFASDPWLGPALMALTDIISDPYPGYSVIPSRCRVTYDRRLLPGEMPEAVLGAITSPPELKDIDLNVRLAEGKHQTYTGETLSGPKFFPAWVLAEDHPFVQAAWHGLHGAGLAPSIGAYRFCTNAAYSAGTAHIPTVGFGPAAEADAHVVDEHLAINELVAAMQGYRGIIEAVLAAG